MDGKQCSSEFAEELKNDIARYYKNGGPRLQLSVVLIGNDPASLRYVSLKKKMAEKLGILFRELFLPDTLMEDAVRLTLRSEASAEDVTAMILQLPLPQTFARQNLCNEIPPEKDCDVLSAVARKRYENGALEIEPPIVSAVSRLLTRYGVSVESYAGESGAVVVAGFGALVGRPLVAWLSKYGIIPRVLTRENPVRASELSSAKLIFSGVGIPGLITADMLGPDAIIIDAGASTARGELVGDVAPEACAYARLCAPVPGGIGPLTVVSLFQNVLTLAQNKKDNRFI